MIFVATGVHWRGFDRLVKAVDNLAGKGNMHDVFVQIGFGNYEPRFCGWTKTMDFFEFEKRMDDADIIISHGGAGCIAGALERNKPTIFVPRLKRYNEVSNDHQLELASVLEKAGRVLVVHDVKDLEQTIERAWNFSPRLAAGESQIVGIIGEFLAKTAMEKGLM